MYDIFSGARAKDGLVYAARAVQLHEGQRPQQAICGQPLRQLKSPYTGFECRILYRPLGDWGLAVQGCQARRNPIDDGSALASLIGPV